MDAPAAPLHSLNPGKRAGNGRPCIVCQLPLKVRSALEERINRGEPVKIVLRWAQKTFPEAAALKYDATARHFRLHTGPIRRAAKKLSDADKMVRNQIKLARDVLAGEVDPQSYFGPAQIAQDIAKTSVRLDLAADDAFQESEYASLASLSGQLLRSHELRAKMGGSIRENPEISLTVSLGELHQRLDGILGAPDSDRQNAARALLGLDGPTAGSLSASADPPVRRQPFADVTNPHGDRLTIDAEPIADPRPQPPLTRPMARKVEAIHEPEPANPRPDDSERPVRPSEEPLGTRWR